MVVHTATGWPRFPRLDRFYGDVVKRWFQGSMWNDQKRISLGVKEDMLRARALELFSLASSEYGGFGQYVGFRRVPPASVTASVRAKPFSEEHLNAGLAGITSPGHSRDFPALDLSASLNGTAKFHFAASLASPRRSRLSLKSSASSEGDTSPVMTSFAPSLSAAQKAINTDCRLSGETSGATRSSWTFSGEFAGRTIFGSPINSL